MTGLDISSDGTKFIVATYDAAVEVDWDLSVDGLDLRSFDPNGADLKKIVIKELVKLPQLEAIAYDRLGGFIYTTEVSNAKAAPIYQANCKRP